MVLNRQTQLGFSLIEVAIVLVVIGLLLSGGLLAISPVVKQSKVTDTKAKIARIDNALVAYLITHSCLPCPANGALAIGTANVGAAVDSASAAYTTGCAPSNACSAAITNARVVPWVNLGLSEGDVTDAFGNRFTYDVTANMVDTSTTDNIRRTTALPVYPPGTLAVNNITGTSLTTTAGYVIASHGFDGFGGYTGEIGVARAAPSSANELENADGDTTFVQGSVNETAGANHFDDIVSYRTPPNIIQACGASSCGNPS